MFPIVVTVVVCLLLPSTAPLVGMLMLGNLFKESGVVKQLAETASNALMYIVVILLGTSVGAKTSGANFLVPTTLKIVVLGLVAFAIGTAAGVLFGKTHVLGNQGKSKSFDWFSRCISGANGSPCITESWFRSRSYKLPFDACHGTKCSRCYRNSSSSRCVYGYLWSIIDSTI